MTYLRDQICNLLLITTIFNDQQTFHRSTCLEMASSNLSFQTTPRLSSIKKLKIHICLKAIKFFDRWLKVHCRLQRLPHSAATSTCMIWRSEKEFTTFQEHPHKSLAYYIANRETRKTQWQIKQTKQFQVWFRKDTDHTDGFFFACGKNVENVPWNKTV